MTNEPITQAMFGSLVGISQQAVSGLVQTGVLPPGGGAAEWLHAYCERLREQAAGRVSAEPGSLDLVQERAALAREQRVGYELRNAAARSEYAPVAQLSAVLALVSEAVHSQLEQLPAALDRAVPDLPPDARQVVASTLASARSEWLRATQALALEPDPTQGFEDGEPDPLAPEQPPADCDPEGTGGHHGGA